jgi:hypothetical protein
MAVTKSQVLKAGKTPAFPIGEGDITFHYTRPTPSYYDEMKKTLSNIDPAEPEKKVSEPTLANTIAAQLMPLITGWDYFDDDEKPMAITQDNLLTLPFGVLRECFEFITEQENPTKNG